MAYQDMHHPRENFPGDRPRDLRELRYYGARWLDHQLIGSNRFLYVAIGVMIGITLVALWLAF